MASRRARAAPTLVEDCDASSEASSMDPRDSKAASEARPRRAGAGANAKLFAGFQPPPTTSSDESSSHEDPDGGEGPLEETTAVAPDGSVITVSYRGVDPALGVGSKEWKKAKRLADNRASAARSRALQRLRVGDMGKQLDDVRAVNMSLKSENERLKALLAAHGIDLSAATAALSAKATTTTSTLAGAGSGKGSAPKAAPHHKKASGATTKRTPAPAAFARTESTLTDASDVSHATQRVSPPARVISPPSLAAASGAPTLLSASSSSTVTAPTPGVSGDEVCGERASPFSSPSLLPIDEDGNVTSDDSVLMGDAMDALESELVGAQPDVMAQLRSFDPAAPLAHHTHTHTHAAPTASQYLTLFPLPLARDTSMGSVMMGGHVHSAFPPMPAPVAGSRSLLSVCAGVPADCFSPAGAPFAAASPVGAAGGSFGGFAAGGSAFGRSISTSSMGLGMGVGGGSAPPEVTVSGHKRRMPALSDPEVDVDAMRGIDGAGEIELHSGGAAKQRAAKRIRPLSPFNVALLGLAVCVALCGSLGGGEGGAGEAAPAGARTYGIRGRLLLEVSSHSGHDSAFVDGEGDSSYLPAFTTSGSGNYVEAAEAPAWATSHLLSNVSTFVSHLSTWMVTSQPLLAPSSTHPVDAYATTTPLRKLVSTLCFALLPVLLVVLSHVFRDTDVEGAPVAEIDGAQPVEPALAPSSKQQGVSSSLRSPRECPSTPASTAAQAVGDLADELRMGLLALVGSSSS